MLDGEQHCRGCGTRRADWVKPNGTPVYPPPYVATHSTCLGCAANAQEQEQVQAEAQDAPGSDRGVTVHLRPWDPASDAD